MVHFGMSFVDDIARNRVQGRAGIYKLTNREGQCAGREGQCAGHIGKKQWQIYPFTRLLLIVLFALLLQQPTVARAQGGGADGVPTTTADQGEISAPQQVDVQPVARDEEIAQRLLTILQSTEWYTNPQVTVRDGIVFLDGKTASAEYRTWAGDLARNTQDVVAVVNRVSVTERSPWDFTPAFIELGGIGRSTLQVLPLILFGLLILVLAWMAMRYTAQLADHLLRHQIRNSFLRNLATTGLSIPVFLLGLYLVLQVSGLTRLAITVLGGTGIAGLIVGIGFRDIMENFLATVLISTRNPFAAGDRIEVAGHLGIVQQVNSRTTVMMSLEGNHIQIPNAIIYKSTIRNFTANPKQRLEFGVGVGYDDDLIAVQQAIIQVLGEHPAVLAQPEPLALVDTLGAATVNLRILFWVDTNQHADIKVKSSVIRLVKSALEESGFSMPDEAREVIFPRGVPVQIVEGQQKQDQPATEHDGRSRKNGRQGIPDGSAPNSWTQRTPSAMVNRPSPLTTDAEGGLTSEDEEIKEQARTSRIPEEDTNLLQEKQ